jgi:protein O-GlcNAc transferase
VNELPALKNGFVTFGCLNNFCKINEVVLDLWGRVMMAAPGSRLMLMAPTGSARRWMAEKLTRLGIDESRLEFVPFRPRNQYLAGFADMDLGLDTYPYNGHTTSLDSLWMGVPVVTRIGPTVVGRAGWSQLSNLGLTELAANDDEQFIGIAAELANDLPRLAQMRRTMRPRLLDSPLADAKGFSRSIEGAFRHMWKEWCGRP